MKITKYLLTIIFFGVGISHAMYLESELKHNPSYRRCEKSMGKDFMTCFKAREARYKNRSSQSRSKNENRENRVKKVFVEKPTDKSRIRDMVSSKPFKVIAGSVMMAGGIWYVAHKFFGIPSPVDIYRSFRGLGKDVKKKLDEEHKKDQKRQKKIEQDLQHLGNSIFMQQKLLEHTIVGFKDQREEFLRRFQEHKNDLKDMQEDTSQRLTKFSQQSKDILKHKKDALAKGIKALKQSMMVINEHQQRLNQDMQQGVTNIKKQKNGIQKLGESLTTVKQSVQQLGKDVPALFAQAQQILQKVSKMSENQTLTESSLKALNENMNTFYADADAEYAKIEQVYQQSQKDLQQAQTNSVASEKKYDELDDSNSGDTENRVAAMLKDDGYAGPSDLDSNL